MNFESMYIWKLYIPLIAKYLHSSVVEYKFNSKRILHSKRNEESWIKVKRDKI